MITLEPRERPKILVVEDNDAERTLLVELLQAECCEAQFAVDGVDALTKLESFEPDVILADVNMTSMDGYEFLTRLQERGPSIPLIALTAFGNAEKDVAIVHDFRAFWFLEKPITIGVLMPLLQRAITQNHFQREAERLSSELSMRGVLGNLVSRSAAMQQVFSLIQQVAPSSAAVMISGESGTGKEIVAREIHRLSARGGSPFVAINCAAIPETLIESELFGHEKGSFTGAVERRIGCFERAHGGTLLLDEVGEMPLQTQTKLLRVLEDMKVRRLGAREEKHINTRIISATNRLPEKAIEERKLREDLYYRLNVFRIDLPPLRDRKEDIDPISEAMIHDLNRRHGIRVTGLTQDALKVLEAHNWPGNVRELRNVIERAMILANTGPIRAQHLRLDPSAVSETSESQTVRGLHVMPGLRLADVESSYIQLTLKSLNNNRKLTANTLGISIRTLQTRIAELRASGGFGSSASGSMEQVSGSESEPQSTTQSVS